MHLPRNAAVALGGTTLAMAGLLEPLVGRGKHLALYHWQGSPTNLYGPAVLGFALVFACLLILLSCGMRPGRWRVAVWGGLLLLLPAFVANGARVLLHLPAVVPAVLFWAGVVALAGLVVFWRDRYSTGFERTVFLGSRGLQVAAFTGAFCLLQILWFWWSARGLNAARPLHAAAGQARANPAHPRVIWIVFDELSFQQGFAERYPGLQLPAFDALAAQSATFTQVRPAEAKADIVLPALIAGKAVKAIRASARGDLWLQTGTGRDWNQLAPSDTIFQDALDAGYRTGVAGWFNPYCRILPSVLDRCSWQYHTSMDNGLGSDETFAGNLRRTLAEVVGRTDSRRWLAVPAGAGTQDTGVGHLTDYTLLRDSAEALLREGSMDFVLLHLPVPHPSGIYDRRTQRFVTEYTTYLDNLALADACLGQMRGLLESMGQWDSSAVVVMGDHSWRVNTMWRNEPGRWTAEEERATHGGGTSTIAPPTCETARSARSVGGRDSLSGGTHTRFATGHPYGQAVWPGSPAGLGADRRAVSRRGS